MLSDLPVPAIFAQLDTAFPGSRFIYTYRPLEAWLSSERNAKRIARQPKPGSTRDYYRTIMYGMSRFSEERFRSIYEDHHRPVTAHFTGARKRDLLVLDVTNGDGWEKLCPFLGLDTPDTAFRTQTLPLRCGAGRVRPPSVHFCASMSCLVKEAG
jgi:hypothetical protein